MKTNRREFLTGLALSTGAGLLTGCATAKGRVDTALGAPMRAFRCAPMKNGIRVGVVGVGSRGFGAVTRLMQVPGLRITAICDIREAYADKAAQAVFEETGEKPLVFSGSD